MSAESPESTVALETSQESPTPAPPARDMSCSPDQRWVWLGGLDRSVSVEDVQSVLSKFGEVERTYVVDSGVRSPSKRHAFVLFKEKQHAQDALKQVREGDATLDGLSGESLRFDWAKPEKKAGGSKTPTPSTGPKRRSPPGFVCICSHKSVQLDDASHFTRDTHDQELHDEMDAHKLKENGQDVQTMFMPGGGFMAVNSNKNLVMGQRAHRMAVFLGKLHNYAELVEKHGINQIKGPNGKHRNLNVAELLCVLYSKMGLSMLPELRGRFAFCMYDPKLVRVLAARDADGTYPVVQAHSGHENLLIACGPYLPEGHTGVIELKPSEYKYGWHAPILQYDGQSAKLAAAQEPGQEGEAAAAKRKNKKKKKPAGAEKKAQEAAEQGQDAAQDASTGQEASAAGDGPRKTRRRNMRRRAAAQAAANSASPDNTNNASREKISLPDSLDDTRQATQDQRKPPRQQKPRQANQENDQQGGDQGDAGQNASRNRRRRRTGSRRTTMEQQGDGNAASEDKAAGSGEGAGAGTEAGAGAEKAASQAASARKLRRGRGSRRATGEQAGGSRRASVDQGHGRGGANGGNLEQVWVAKKQPGGAGAGKANAQELLEDAEALLGLSSHKISVGQDLDNLGSMLAAGLAGSSPKEAGKVANALVEAVAAMKPSGSCGELTNMIANGNQGTKLVC